VRSTSIADYFSDYRAEWPAQNFGSLFVQPPYFSKLEMLRPCFVIGGRGTGKTTVLKSLRFGSVEIQDDASTFSHHPDKPYLGVYLRMNKNRVRAFTTSEINESLATRAFTHYFNVLAGQELCKMTAWLSSKGLPPLSSIALNKIAAAYGVQKEIHSADALYESLAVTIVQLELWVNNGGRGECPNLSIAEAPLRYFVEALDAAGALAGRQVFCCIDEYENLVDWQQAAINTYLKHSEPPLSYKIGIRRGGLKTRNTSDQLDQISTPDDYVEIDIRNESFGKFALDVLEHRLARARESGINVGSATSFLPELTFEEEAIALGCERISDQIFDELRKEDTALFEWAKTVPKHQLYFIQYWSDSGNGTVIELAHDWMNRPSHWETRFANYSYASLFWLSRGRKGARIRKYYAGVETFVQLASGNIRYFLELVDSAIAEQLRESSPLQVGQEFVISPKAQTLAARLVAKRRLDQLEGLSERGIELKRLVLAIGKVFFELARDPAGRAPEQNSFVLSGGGETREQVMQLLADGVSHLAFESDPRTKPTSTSELRDEEYRLHPIFCPFFEYSYRRKRRITIKPEDIIRLRTEPSRAIADMTGSKREQLPKKELPEQLAMFSDFFGD
jgi:hypothetical protein